MQQKYSYVFYWTKYMHIKLSHMAKCIMWACFINHWGDSELPVLTGLAFLAGPYSGIVLKEYKNHIYYVNTIMIITLQLFQSLSYNWLMSFKCLQLTVKPV